jgi:hypothetical protein
LITKFKTDAASPPSTQAARTWRNLFVLQAQVAVVTSNGLDADPPLSERQRKGSGTG